MRLFQSAKRQVNIKIEVHRKNFNLDRKNRDSKLFRTQLPSEWMYVPVRAGSASGTRNQFAR